MKLTAFVSLLLVLFVVGYTISFKFKVVAAGIYYDPQHFLTFVSQLQPHGANTLNYITNELLTVASKIDGIHNRKMVVIALCTMARLPLNSRPSLIVERANAVC